MPLPNSNAIPSSLSITIYVGENNGILNGVDVTCNPTNQDATPYDCSACTQAYVVFDNNGAKPLLVENFFAGVITAASLGKLTVNCAPAQLQTAINALGVLQGRLAVVAGDGTTFQHLGVGFYKVIVTS
jgi:hypothetical protein